MSIDPLDDDNGTFSSWSTGGRLGAVVEPGVRDVAETLPDVAIADLRDVGQPSDRGLPLPHAWRPTLTRASSHLEKVIEIGDSRFSVL